MQRDNQKKSPLYLIREKNLPIFEQLQIEEALLHASDKNYCLMNEGTSLGIVMGLSNKEDELIYLESCKEKNVPVYRRFSGGGTVVVDQDTMFVSMIFDQNVLKEKKCYPEVVMRWNYQIYKELFSHDDFRCIENDFAFKEKKCAGNAQYIKQKRWIQHTAFLWGYEDKNMSLLKIPKKAPDYRLKRDHKDFLTTIKPHFSLREDFFNRLEDLLREKFDIKKISLEQVREQYLNKNYRKNNKILV